jgi:transposase
VLLPRTARAVTPLVRVINDLASDWRRLDERIEDLSSEIEALARRGDAGCERPMSIPGIGPIISSAMVAAIGTGDGFPKGCDFAAWLGLVPKQISTRDRPILGKISKRGNRYLRVLFVQAAWVVHVKMKPTRWDCHGLKHCEAAKKRLHHTCWRSRLSTSLARIAWSALARGRAFEASKLQAATDKRVGKYTFVLLRPSWGHPLSSTYEVEPDVGHRFRLVAAPRRSAWWLD